MAEVKELSYLERLKLSLKYSISEKHKKSLRDRIDKLEGKKAPKVKEEQLSLLK